MPSFYLKGAGMIDTANHIVRQAATAIQSSAIVLRYFTLFACDELARLQIKFGCSITPESDRYWVVSIVTDDYVSFVPALSCFKFEVAHWTHINNDTDSINNHIGHQLLDLLYVSEREPHLVDLIIVFAILDLRILVESNAEVILYRCVLLVSHFDLAATKNVNTVLLQLFKPSNCYFIKHGRLDHSAFSVDKVEIEDMAFTSVVSVMS